MADIFVDQPLKLILETNVDLTTALTQQILFKQPDGTEGAWNATVDGTTIFFLIPGDTLTNGTWYFHSSVKFSGFSFPHTGRRAQQYVKAEFERNYV